MSCINCDKDGICTNRCSTIRISMVTKKPEVEDSVQHIDNSDNNPCCDDSAQQE
jgi:hypothetical protein